MFKSSRRAILEKETKPSYTEFNTLFLSLNRSSLNNLLARFDLYASLFSLIYVLTYYQDHYERIVSSFAKLFSEEELRASSES